VKVLVTGGAGFIGSHLTDLLVASGHEVTVLDNLDPQVHGPHVHEPRFLLSHIAKGAVRFVKGDVINPLDVAAALEDAEVVVHLAAAVGVGQSMYAPHRYVHTNCTGSAVILDVVGRARGRIKRLVVASSMSIYGEGAYECTGCGNRPAEVSRDADQLRSGRWEPLCSSCGACLDAVPTNESHKPHIASVYAATKKHQEDLFMVFGQAYGIPTVALRFFNVFGSRQSLSNPYTGVAAIFTARLLSGRPPLVFEDGLQSRDLVDVRDVAQALLLSVELEVGGQHVLNVGTGHPVTIRDLAAMLADGLGVRQEPMLLNRYRQGDIRHCFADASRAREILGFTAEHTLATGLGHLLEWCRVQAFEETGERSLEELERRRLIL
jgi:dTDP-L-rhamnose 4-epimerase